MRGQSHEHLGEAQGMDGMADIAKLETSGNAQSLYYLVIQTSNQFLHNCKHFAIEVLQTERPTYAEVALLMKQVSGIIEVLAADFDPMMGQKARDYCELMSLMGVAIEAGDQVRLTTLVTELDRRPGL
jgi:hypothetical protein